MGPDQRWHGVGGGVVGAATSLSIYIEGEHVPGFCIDVCGRCVAGKEEVATAEVLVACWCRCKCCAHVCSLLMKYGWYPYVGAKQT